MKNTKHNVSYGNKFGFTLIELLVVITIIGILATTGVGIFTKQLQGARDSTRINDFQLFDTALSQVFSDDDAYPATTDFSSKVWPYMSKVLVDPKDGVTTCTDGTTTKVVCSWVYNVDADNNGLPSARYKIALYFEKPENQEQIAAGNGKKTDGGTDDWMYELFAGWSWQALAVGTQDIY